MSESIPTLPTIGIVNIFEIDFLRFSLYFENNAVTLQI